MKLFTKVSTYSPFPFNMFSLIISTILLVLSFFTEKFFITVKNPDLMPYISSKILFFITIYFVSNFLITFSKKVIIKDPFHSKWVKYLLIIGIPYLAIFFITWPGVIVWDEFWVYKCASELVLDDWQSFLTVYYYLINLYLFPSMATVTFTQLGFLAFVSSWIITNIENNYQKSAIIGNILLFILLTSPAIIFSTLTTYRSTMLAILELWLVGMLYFCIRNSSKVNWPLFWIGLCTILLSTWRKEGIYHLILVPFAIYFINTKINKRALFTLLITVVISTIVINNFPGVVRDQNTKMKYELTSLLNPISNMLVDKNLVIDEETLTILNQVINVEKSKEFAYPYEIPGYWGGVVFEGLTQENFNSFKKEYYKIILDNPDLFISQRLRTLLASTGLSQYGNYPNDYINYFFETSDEHQIQVVNTMANKFNHPITDFRNIIISYLDWSKSFNGPIKKLSIFWNVLPIVFMLLVIIFRARSISDPLFWLSLICIARVPLLLYAEPGSYFMYYFPMYIAGIFISAFYLLEFIKRKSYQNL